MLFDLADRLPGARVLDGRFSGAELAFALPKGRTTALAYVSQSVDQARSSGAVGDAIKAAGLRGVQVAGGK